MPLPTKDDGADTRRRAALVAVAALGGALLVWRCGRSASDPSNASSLGEPSPSSPSIAAPAPSGRAGLGAPIAAARVGADLVVAGLDLAARAVRVQRIDDKGEIAAERLVLDDVAWSPEADVKLVASPSGVAVTWRGLRKGELVRKLVVLGPDLAPRGEPADVAAASCATRDAIWSIDGAFAHTRPWTGAPSKVALPKDVDASLLCGSSRAFAVLSDDDKTSVLALGSGGAPITMMRESDFGEDEQRELAEYTVGDEAGFVRLAASGALAVRELAGTAPGPLRRLKSAIGRDDDVVAVDASSRIVVVVYTQDVSGAAANDTGASPEDVVCTKVSAVRVDRQTFDESTVELSPGRCGYEVGPFFTGAIGDDVSIAWVERASRPGTARAPITGLSHARVAPSGTPAVGRVEQPAGALVEAGCEGTSCFAVALVRAADADAASPGIAKVLRYP